jgi:hypothetical protein
MAIVSENVEIVVNGRVILLEAGDEVIVSDQENREKYFERLRWVNDRIIGTIAQIKSGEDLQDELEQLREERQSIEDESI